jgi:protoheme ferro-lyase
MALKHLENYDLTDIKVNVIDRWYFNDGYIKSIARLIKEDLAKEFSHVNNEEVLLLFSAHSIPFDFMA